MKVNQSTKRCEEYNKTNAEAIGAGLMEAWEPSDAIIRQEKEQLVKAASVEEFKKLCGQFWRLVIAQLSTEDAQLFTVEQTEATLSRVMDTYSLSTRGEVEARLGYSGCYDRISKLKVCVGEYGDRHNRRQTYQYKVNEIAKLAVDAEFAKKVAAAIQTRIAANRIRVAHEKATEDAYKLRNKVYEANQAFFNSIGLYSSDIVVDGNGDIRIAIPIKGNIERLKEIAAFAKAAKA